MILDQLCKDNVICCDDNCKRCANLIYQKYIEQKAEIERLEKYNTDVAFKHYNDGITDGVEMFAKRFESAMLEYGRFDTFDRGAVLNIKNYILKEMAGDNNV